jgi:hypothetical protein
MSTKEYTEFVERGWYDLSRYRHPATYLTLCRYCGRANLMFGVWIIGLLALLALSVYPICLHCNRKMYPENRRTGKPPIIVTWPEPREGRPR